MSKAISIRLDDQLLDDCKAWASKQGVTLTDMIIAGLLSQLQGSQAIAAPVIVHPGASCETVYIPDPVKPAKAPKIKSNAAPVVSAMLSGISKRLTVTHHPTCTCGICKPV